jgi:lipopolysaccharide transport system ATP-binding protein
VERFIDTPVKRYSSGMYLRLAFAVAAYLEPEILLVDEVLSVGDAAFQKKCIGQMATVAHAGRTVLFVSHNLTAVEGICQRAIRLQEGRVVDDGPTSRVISGYLRSAIQARREVEWTDPATAPGNSDVRLRRVSVRPVAGGIADPISVTTPFVVEFEYWNFDGAAHISPSLRLYNEQDVLICDVCSPIAPQWREHVSPVGLVRAMCRIPGNLLNDGLHRMEISLARNGILTVKGGATLVFNVLDSDEQREGWYGEWAGVLRPMFDWEIDIPAESPGEGAGSG